MPPLLSVVIPAYNAAPFLREAVASVDRQTYAPIELVIVNDGSSDATGAIIDALAADVSRAVPVRAIHQPNGGVSSARNRGIEAARGALIGFLDADDAWEPRCAERLIAAMMQDPSIGLMCAGWRIMTESGVRTHRVGAPLGVRFMPGDLLISNPVTSSIARREVVLAAGLFDEAMRHCEDLDLWLRIALQPGVRVAAIQEPLFARREWPDQATRNWRSMHQGWLTVFERFMAHAPGEALAIEGHARANADRLAAFYAYQAGDFAAARRLVFSAWRRAPLRLARSARSYPITAAALATLLPTWAHRPLDRTFRRLREGSGTRA